MVDDIKISDKELKDLDAAIELQKLTEKQKIEREVREKIAAEQKQVELEEHNKKLSLELENLKKSQDEKEQALRAEIQRQLDDLKNQKQSVPDVKNPFDNQKPADIPNLRDPKVLDKIEENSRETFLKKFKNLPDDWGRI